MTRGEPGALPPSPIYAASLPVPWVRDWYGNNAIWVRLAPTGVLPALDNAGVLKTKYPWWRVLPGTIAISARRLDGPGTGFSGDTAPSGYGDTGFVPGMLTWPALGCWQITGTLDGGSLTFTVWVQHFPGM